MCASWGVGGVHASQGEGVRASQGGCFLGVCASGGCMLPGGCASWGGMLPGGWYLSMQRQNPLPL